MKYCKIIQWHISDLIFPNMTIAVKITTGFIAYQYSVITVDVYIVLWILYCYSI